jgi:hypothetical protein
MSDHRNARVTGQHLPAIGADFWGMAVGLGLLLMIVQLSYTEFSFMRDILGQNTPEGVAAGWWWSISALWLINALRRPAASKADAMSRGFRSYLFSAFTLLGAIEIAQQGVPAALGFQVGAGAFAIVYAIGGLGVASVKTVRVAARARQIDAIQLPLPFI